MQYDIKWIKSLEDIDLIIVNLLSFMRLYKYNLYNPDVRKSITLEQAEAKGIKRMVIKLRTQNGKVFNAPYYLPEDEALEFIDKLKAYFEKEYR